MKRLMLTSCFYFLILATFISVPGRALAEEKNSTETTDTTSSLTGEKKDEKTALPIDPAAVVALLGDAKEIKKIEQKTVEAKEDLKKNIAIVEEAKKTAEKAVEEKKVLEKDVQVKEQAIALVKQELEIVKKEAEVKGDKASVAKVRELVSESSELEQEAELSRERLAIAEQKAKLADESIQTNHLAIESLKKDLVNLQKEKVVKQGLLPKAFMAGSIVFIGLFLMIFLNWSLNKFEQLITEKDAIREKESTLRLKTLAALFKWTGTLVILGVVIYMVLDNSGLDMAPLLAGAGILGLALGFGSQYLIRDIINGIFILVEGQYNINDIVKIGDFGGLVESFNLRHTRLRDLEGRVIYIPNGKVETVINYTQEYAQAVINIGVAYKENVDQVMQVLSDIGDEMRLDNYYGRLILDKLEMLGVDAFEDSQVTIKCRVKTLPIKQWEVAREFRRRVKNKFDELDIEIPFPHKTVFEGKPKDMSKLEAWRRERESQGKSTMKRGHGGEIF